jgi:glucokinase
VACHIRDQAMKYLGAAVAGLLLAMDPEILIVGGQIAESGEAVFAPLRRDLYERTRGMLGREVPVVPAKVGERSGIVGAAALVLYT